MHDIPDAAPGRHPRENVSEAHPEETAPHVRGRPARARGAPACSSDEGDDVAGKGCNTQSDCGDGHDCDTSSQALSVAQGAQGVPCDQCEPLCAAEGSPPGCTEQCATICDGGDGGGDGGDGAGGECSFDSDCCSESCDSDSSSCN